MRKPKLVKERLKEKREEKGWSKNYAAEEMCLTQSGYLRYESGEVSPSYSAIKNMALTLGTSVEYLTGKTDDDRPMQYLVDCSDPRMSFIIETFNSSEENKSRLYNYAKRISQST